MGDVTSASRSAFTRMKVITAINATIDSFEMAVRMMQAGVDGYTFRYSPAESAMLAKQIRWIRKASKETSRHVAIIQNLTGVDITVDEFDGVLNVASGRELRLGYKQPESDMIIPLSYDISKSVQRGDRILLDNGKIQSIVTSVRPGIIGIRIQNEGIITPGISLELPDTSFATKMLAKHDRQGVVFGVDNDVDFFSIGQIESSNDLKPVQTLLRNLQSNAHILVRVATKKTVSSVEMFAGSCDGIIVESTALSREMSETNLVATQSRLMQLCRQHGLIGLVDLSDLENQSTTPTISALTFYTLASFDGLCVSTPQTPLRIVKKIKQLLSYVEQNQLFSNLSVPAVQINTDVITVVTQLARSFAARAIIAEMTSDETRDIIIAARPELPLIVTAPRLRDVQQLAIAYGIQPLLQASGSFEKVTESIFPFLQTNDTVLIMSSRHSDGFDAFTMRTIGILNPEKKPTYE